MILNNFLTAYRTERNHFDTSKPYTLKQYISISRNGKIFFLRNRLKLIGMGAIMVGCSMSKEIKVKENQAYIASYVVAKPYRGKGHSKTILINLERMCLSMNLDSIVAVVKPSNIPSIRAFRSMGYKEKNSIIVNSLIGIKDDGRRTIVIKDL